MASRAVRLSCSRCFQVTAVAAAILDEGSGVVRQKDVGVTGDRHSRPDGWLPLAVRCQSALCGGAAGQGFPTSAESHIVGGTLTTSVAAEKGKEA
jgi:hypothetical protein